MIAEEERNTQSIVKSPSLTPHPPPREHASWCRAETTLGISLPGYSATSDVLESKSCSTTQMSESFPTGERSAVTSDTPPFHLRPLGNLSFVQHFLAHLGKAAKVGKEES